ncbi:helix-turn-helix transcriptional regulator [Rhodocytophaga rosea]|uniref:Helix-turn-helix transcriptional regulator n=1 Tax=Rhodocytophaga rosea TaxID=2704465 RepID=A0A6C0GG97_9BACT|nr:helix-turn-helix transcriptional regulator [Rhodocytophaga rosea]QHT66803.1 helix-turn-helix transcriptional regulator [Rhodocytophaga rosea]
MKIGNKIRKLRELRNFTQEYMAAQLNLSQTAYCKIEKDETKVSIVRLEQIAKILSISVKEILSFDEQSFFGNMSPHPNTGHGIPHSVIPEEKKLYESRIHQLKEENKHLRDLILYLQKGS